MSVEENTLGSAEPDSHELSAAQLKRELEQIDGRDLQLWSIAILVAITIAGGLLAVAVPNMWGSDAVLVQARFLPTLLMGFIVMVVLVNIYFLDQRRQIKRARIQVFQQLLRAEVAERDARMDPLTSCFNRRCLDPLLQKEIKRAERMETAISVVVIDLDDFRTVNSKFGHLQGDVILKAMVELIRKTLRASDTVVRYGGDEFVLILPEANDHQANCAMGRVMNAVAKWNARNEVPGYQMSLSWGIAEYEQGVTGPDLVDRADRKMYEAKHRGRVPVG
jgi:diguanylate cyclase (GGDEF)-like protein